MNIPVETFMDVAQGIEKKTFLDGNLYRYKGYLVKIRKGKLLIREESEVKA